MRSLLLVGLVFLATLASTRVVPSSEPPLDETAYEQNQDSRDLGCSSSEWAESATAADGGSAWDKAVESGRTLYSAMKSKDSVARWFFKNYPDFAETVQSPYDGDLREKLKEWGYDDSEELSKALDKECDFDVYHKIKNAFDELGLGTKAKANGGPNQCFQINHQDGPNVKRNDKGELPGVGNQYYEVCGKEYRVTGGTHDIAVNPAGAVILMNVISAAWSAEKHYWGRKPATNELPHIRSTSDIAWGVWNRVAAGNIKEIKYLMVTQIMNASTRDLIRAAYATLSPPQSETKVWPGIDFSMDSVGGQALLGSPVGRWAGYFLMQHKTQLSGNRFITKVRVFKPDGATLPVLIFYVDPTPAPDNLVSRGTSNGSLWSDNGSSRIVKRSADGKSVIREHIILAKF